MIRSYRWSAEVLRELRALGLPEAYDQALAAEPFGVYSHRAMLGLLQRCLITNRSWRRAILRRTRRGLLRLDRLIRHRATREWVEALLLAFVLASVLRHTVAAPFKIPSGSMKPTIAVGDHIFASMYSYGLRIPFTGIKWFSAAARRGDIVIFPFPEDPAKDYIKRVIAMGGETITVRGRQTFIDGQLLEEPYAFFDPFMEARLQAQGYSLEYGPYRVPDGHVFVMGDNRYNSADSRVWGAVDGHTLKGRGRIVYWHHDPRSGWFAGYDLLRTGMILR